MYTIFKQVISRGVFDFAAIIHRVDAFTADGQLTPEQRTDLRGFAADQVDLSVTPQYAELVAQIRKEQEGEDERND